MSRSNLREWIQTVTPEDFPPAPFELSPGITIVDSARWLSWLKADAKSQYHKDHKTAVEDHLTWAYKAWNSEHIKKLDAIQF